MDPATEMWLSGWFPTIKPGPSGLSRPRIDGSGRANTHRARPGTWIRHSLPLPITCTKTTSSDLRGVVNDPTSQQFCGRTCIVANRIICRCRAGDLPRVSMTCLHQRTKSPAGRLAARQHLRQALPVGPLMGCPAETQVRFGRWLDLELGLQRLDGSPQMHLLGQHRPGCARGAVGASVPSVRDWNTRAAAQAASSGGVRSFPTRSAGTLR